MKFYDIKQQLEPLVVFSIQDIYIVDPDFRRSTLYDWEKDKKVLKLRNHAYIFGDFVPQDLDFYLISNKLYRPSYISVELALNHYGVIPEVVTSITAITTNKTQTFTTPVATFIYQSIKPGLFFGYELLQVRDHGVMIASLEKTILDYLYLHADIDSVEDFVSLRWHKQQLQAKINQQKLADYLAIFSSDALTQRVNQLRTYMGA